MDYFELKDTAEDICMAYGFKLNENINFDRWNPEDEKLVRDYLEIEDERLFEIWYADQN